MAQDVNISTNPTLSTQRWDIPLWLKSRHCAGNVTVLWPIDAFCSRLRIVNKIVTTDTPKVELSDDRPVINVIGPFCFI
jgi:hypothetical protein